MARFFDEKGFYLAMIACVDYKEYLELVYIFANHASLCKVKISLKVDPVKPVAPTLSAIFDCAYWYEREIREFYGVLFDGHPNLTYLFLHEGIDFYPAPQGEGPRFRRGQAGARRLQAGTRRGHLLRQPRPPASEHPRRPSGSS